MLENYTENLIRDVLKENRKLYPSCNWGAYEDDIIRTALNKMAPKYFLSTSGEAEKKVYLLNKQIRMEVLIKITEAVVEICGKI